MTADSIFASLRIVNLSLIALVLLAVIRGESRGFKKYVLLSFLVCMGSYFVVYGEGKTQDNIPGWLYHPLLFLSVQLPLTLYLVSRALFRDKHPLFRRPLWWLFILPPLHYALYRLPLWVEGAFIDEFRLLPYLLSMLLAGGAIVETLRDREADLVLARLHKRHAFIALTALLAVVSVTVYFLGDPMQLPTGYALIQQLLSILFILLFFGGQFHYRSLFPPEKRSAAKPPPAAGQEKVIVEKLLTAIEEEGLHRKEGLTIGVLARHISVKEYQLRRAINGELDYTNFNSFLNHYRIAEARQWISAPENAGLTFQEIAYRLGYQSVATFNRAFKSETGQTPTAFRESCLKAPSTSQK